MHTILAPSSRNLPWTLGVVAFLTLLGVPRIAEATPNFPAALQKAASLAAPPDCALCHAGNPGKGTAQTPFVRSMVRRGLVPFDEASLATAVAALKAEGIDSDGDGVADIGELEAGQDPNLGVGAEPPLVPAYGCGARVAPPGAPAGSTSIPRSATLHGIGVVALGIWAARRRRVA